MKSGLVLAYLASTAIVPEAAYAQKQPQAEPPSETTADNPEQRAGDLEEIVVTANRRSERLQDVPAAVSALTGDTLESQNAQSFSDFARSIPGLNFSDAGTGRQQPSIRGVNALGVGGATVGYYIDEASLPASSGSIRLTNIDPSLYDLNRAEVLRGPQGTLYGSGSMGGTIKLIPNRPTTRALEATFRARGEAVDGGNGAIDLAGMVNVPISTDLLALRATAWFRSGGGFIDRFAGDEKVDEVPDERTFGFRAALGLTPVSNVTAIASVFHQKQKFDGFQSVTFGADNPSGRLRQDFIADIKETNRNEFTLYNLTVNADLGPVALVSSTSLYESSYSGAEESTAALDLFFGQPTPSSLFERNSQRVFSQELRLSSARPMMGFEWLLGGFMQRQDTKRYANWLVPGFAAFAGDDLLYLERSSRENDQNALFGELTYNIGSRFAVTAGLRYYEYEAQGKRTGDGAFNGGPSFTDDEKSGDHGLIKKFNASWKPSEKHLLYAQYAEGFRPGFARAQLPTVCADDAEELGIDPGPSQVDPDRVNSYEIGSKNTLFNRKVTLNIAAYRIDWKKIQLGLFLPCGFSFSSNAGDAKITGLEVETSARLGGGVDVGGSLTYTHSELVRILPGTVAQPGDAILGTPKWQASAYAQSTFGGPFRSRGFGRVDFQYTGEALLFYHDDPDTAPAPLSFKYRPDIFLVGARLGFELNDWNLSFFARNILNNVEVVGFPDLLVANISDRPRFIVNKPRTLGIEFSKRF